MNNSCKSMQDVLIDQILGPLPEEDARLLAEHVDNCSECGRFRKQLISQDQILGEWGRNMQEQMAEKAERAAAAFLARKDVQPKKVLTPLAWYAAAAVVIVGMLLGLLWQFERRTSRSRPEFAAPGIKQQMDREHPQAEKQLVASEKTAAEKELQLAELFFEKGNVTALAALYQAGQHQTRQAVLNYLAQIGTEEALRTLADLMESEQSAADPNRSSVIVPSVDEESKSESRTAEAVEPAAGEKLPAPIEERAYYDPEAEDVDNWRSGVLGIRVLDDETGQPIGGADLKFRSYPKLDLPEAAATNQYGRYELKYYNPDIRYLRVAVSQAPYAGKYLSWSPPESGTGVPLQYHVRLKKGVTAGGLVETDEGRPLEGVHVDLRFSMPDESAVESVLIDDTDLVTGQNGRWELGCFPADLKEDIFISVEHPEYVSVERYSIQAELETLLNKSNVIQMEKGLTVGGQVTDGEGRPIEGAAIYTGTSRYVSDNRQTQTYASGGYTISNCKAHELVLTVLAEGYAPELREVVVSETLGDVNFQLEPGHSVVVRVVDRNGNGIEGVKIEGDEWRTYGGYQEAQTIRCSAQTDALGYATLTDLPADEVRYTVQKRGYASYNNYPMIAGEQNQYELALLPEGKLTGRVLDSQTGLPVDTFMMIEGIQWRNQKEPTWQSMRRKICANGMYEQKLYYQDLGLAVRIEAEGYLPSESDVYLNEGREIVEDIVLYQGQGPGGIVVLSDGQPAYQAEVFVRNQDYHIDIENGRILQGIDRVVSDQTDEEGRLQLPVVESPYCLIVLHEAGGAVISGEQFEQTGTIPLQPWSTVEGTVYLGNKPAANQRVALHPAFPEDECGHISVTWKVTTDDDGRFSCGRLFPGRIQISRIVPLDNRSDRYVNTRFVLAEPGQTATIDIGQGGRMVIGQLILSEEMKGSSADHIELTVQSAAQVEFEDYPGIEFPETYFVMTVEEKQQWQQTMMQTEAWKEYMKKMQALQNRAESFHESVIAGPDGALRAENIPAGSYLLSGSIGDPKLRQYSSEWYQNRLGKVEFSFTVPEAADQADYEQPVDLGKIPVEPFGTLQVGQAAPGLSMADTEGNRICLEDYLGNYLLLDLGMVMQAENPQDYINALKTATTKFHEAGQLEILSVFFNYGLPGPNINESVRKAIRYLIENREIDWPVGLINLSSPTDVFFTAYPQGTVPSLLLIGPDGRLEALRIKPEELMEILKQHLQPIQEEEGML